LLLALLVPHWMHSSLYLYQATCLTIVPALLLPSPVRLFYLNFRICAVTSMYWGYHLIYPCGYYTSSSDYTPQRQRRTELSSIFSHFGTVTHSVILATVDNASRRRGFVVMSTHTEAKAAMDNISQTNIRCVTATA
jgi:hypothetical protein